MASGNPALPAICRRGDRTTEATAAPWGPRLQLPAAGITVRAYVERWNRRSAECGQIHALQCRHPHPQRRRRRTIPFAPSIRTSASSRFPTPRLETLSKLSHSQKIIPAAIEFVDIAGLVKGASAGEGLGNQFLSHIREVNAIVQVVRCFENADIHHVSGTIDPIRDIEVINTELVLADLASLQKRHDRLQKEVRAGSKTAKAEVAVIDKLLPHLDAGKPAITFQLTEEEKAVARDFFLLSSKPTLFACNVAESDLACDFARNRRETPRCSTFAPSRNTPGTTSPPKRS